MSGHYYPHEFHGPKRIPVRRHVIWFVLSPSEGIEVVPTAITEQAIDEVAQLPGSKMVSDSSGVYVFRWEVPSQYRYVSFGGSDRFDAWTSPGIAGTPVLAGPESRWHLVSTGQKGSDSTAIFGESSVADTSRMSGCPRVDRSMSKSGTIRQIACSHAITSGQFPGALTSPCTSEFGPRASRSALPGDGRLSRDFPIPQSPGDQIEVRVWSAGGPRVEVWTVAVSNS